jgi:hypothetical protein
MPLLCRNFFLNFDGMSHVTALEQNFNPNYLDVERRKNRGIFVVVVHLLLCGGHVFFLCAQVIRRL